MKLELRKFDPTKIKSDSVVVFIGKRNTGNSFSVKEVDDAEKEIHTKELEKLKNKLDNVLFISYSTNIFGIKLK